MKNRAWKLLFTYILFYLISPAIALALGVAEESIPWVLLVSMLIICFVAWYLYGKYTMDQWQRLLQQTSWKSLLGKTILCFLIIGIVRIILLSLIEPYIDLEGMGANQQAIQDLIGNVPSYFTFFMLVIFAPFVEELIFRQAIIGPSVHKGKSFKWSMTILSILLFTGAHMATLADAVIYLPLTLGLTYFYWKYQANVAASMSFHFINNLIAWITLTFFT
ncbi:lysostaphin resistance A-like protein [Facklamia sp. P12955]|uniref:CPBP family intramembrane glutamic endopeptidase n=1 Tax=unclassified Facklamia TaxID=2622293 RepID=UPI003D1783DC